MQIPTETFSKNHYCPMHANSRDWLGRRMPMSKTCPTCPWATNVRGKNPQDNTDVDNWGCAVPHGIFLQIEDIKLLRSIRETLDKKLNQLASLSAQGLIQAERSRNEFSSNSAPAYKQVENGSAQQMDIIDVLEKTKVDN